VVFSVVVGFLGLEMRFFLSFFKYPTRMVLCKVPPLGAIWHFL